MWKYQCKKHLVVLLVSFAAVQSCLDLWAIKESISFL